MGKNTIGGKKHKRKKNIVVNNKVDIPTNNQYFGVVVKMLGSGRVNLDYFINENELIEEKGTSEKSEIDSEEKTDNNEIQWRKYNKIGIIRGSMMKRVWINVGDVVLVTEREFEKNKVDIICKYNQQQLFYLKKHTNIPILNDDKINDIEFDIKSDEEGEDNDSTYFNKKLPSNNKLNPYIDNISESADEEDIEDI